MSAQNTPSPSAARDRMEQVLERFEDAWRAGRRPRLEDYLDGGGAERRALLIELVHADLHYRLDRGEAARVESYLASYPELAEEPAAALELMESEYRLRRRTEPDLDFQEYRQRFPARPDVAAVPSPAPALPAILGPEAEPECSDRPGISAETIGAENESASRRESTRPSPAPAPLAETGEPFCVPGYEVLEELGRGGMGVVYKARQIGLGRLVALKMILAGGRAGAAEVRFRTEAEAVARLQHPNIVQIHEVGEHQGKPFFSLELCEGGSMDHKLAGNSLPAEEAAELVGVLARAMQAAHQANVIHRDLKPANVLLTADGTPKITDFGLAKKLDESGQTQTGAIVGTPSYMAPEQARAKQQIGPAADVYALGAILYELLTGRPPFKAATAFDTLAQVMADEPAPPRQINAKTPQDLETICLKCLQKEPGARYATARGLADDLERFRRGEAIHARPVGRLERLVKWVRREPLVAGLVAALVLVVGLIGVGGLALIRIQSDRGDYVIDTDDPDFSFRVNKGAVTLQDHKTKRKYALKVLHQDRAAGEYELEVSDPDAGLSFKTKSFTIKRGEQVALKAWFERKEGAAAKRGPAAVDEAWLKQVAAMPAAKQVEAVALRLKERNPGFDGTVTPTVQGGVVTGLEFLTDNVRDVLPVRALTGLRRLVCSGRGRKGPLADLSPLKDMKLTWLDCGLTQVSDLSPLKDMKLTYLSCYDTPVSDLSPLKDMNLTYLSCGSTKVSDLSPLKDMRLKSLTCSSTQVSDLSPLKDMNLTELYCGYTPVFDLSPLKSMKLTVLDCGSTQVSDLSPLKDMKLTTLGCGSTQVLDLSPLKDMKLTHLNVDITKVSDLSPLKDMKLTTLHCYNTQVSDLLPLKDMKLSILYCDVTPVSSLSPLKDMNLTTLVCRGTKVSDLSPLKDMKLTSLYCYDTPVSDLSPLKDMNLTSLWCQGTKVRDLSPLRGMPLKELRCDFKPERDAEILRSLKTLESINQQPANEFWRDVNAKKLNAKP